MPSTEAQHVSNTLNAFSLRLDGFIENKRLDIVRQHRELDASLRTIATEINTTQRQIDDLRVKKESMQQRNLYYDNNSMF